MHLVRFVSSNFPLFRIKPSSIGFSLAPSSSKIRIFSRKISVPLFILNPEEPKLAGVLLRWWALAFVILCVAAVLSRLAVGLLYFIGEIVIKKSDRIFYYINDLEWPFALLGWGGGMLITLNVWLKDLEPNVFKAFHIIFIMTIVRLKLQSTPEG